MGLNKAVTINSDKIVASLIRQKHAYLTSKLTEFKRNSKWIAEERENLRKEYPNVYIAVRGQKVFAKEKNLSELIERINKIEENEDIVLDYISEKRIKLLL